MDRQQLLQSIATTTADYRAGKLAAPTPEHVDRWVRQFDEAVQLQILAEMDHVLKKTYFPLQRVTTFLSQLLVTEKLLAGKDSCGFWRQSRFLDCQGGGNSQHEMLEIFSQLLESKCGIRHNQCGTQPDCNTFVYLDDAIFTGNRVLKDVVKWIAEEAPAEATLHIIAIALHRGGQHYANGKIQEAIRQYGKKVSIEWWRAIELEDTKARGNVSDVLRPAAIPNDPCVTAYVAQMKYPPALRQPGFASTNQLFTGEPGRDLLEQEFLKVGAKLREQCPQLGVTQRPLGHITLDTLGFGSLIVTFRNCPNNAPLALWVGDPWYPLFPRTTNRQTANKRFIEEFLKDWPDGDIPF